jgi:alanine-glyoxylate transaminase / serine-glyoxylate transaminase / serine-pyruvate transaminase
MLPSTERLLLGPGPSPVSSRIMRAMSAPVLSHLDSDLMAILDGIRTRLTATFKAPPDGLALAISGTGTSGMEAAVANLTRPGSRALVVVSGYFGDRLAQMLERYGATVTRVEGEWGRASDPSLVERALANGGADIVAMVHAETSTGVINPVADICAIAQRHGALTIVDAVTSLGAHPVDVAGWGVDACYSCTQKGLGAPSGLAPIAFSARARSLATGANPHRSRSFYFDLQLLEDYWVRRKYHHTISAPLIYALSEALLVVEEEGLEARASRHCKNHMAMAEGLQRLGLSLLPPAAERLWSLNAVVVPEGVDEAAVRKRLLQEYDIEIGAGLGPLAGKIWRVGLMGSGSTPVNIARFLTALAAILNR